MIGRLLQYQTSNLLLLLFQLLLVECILEHHLHVAGLTSCRHVSNVYIEQTSSGDMNLDVDRRFSGKSLCKIEHIADEQLTHILGHDILVGKVLIHLKVYCCLVVYLCKGRDGEIAWHLGIALYKVVDTIYKHHADTAAEHVDNIDLLWFALATKYKDWVFGCFLVDRLWCITILTFGAIANTKGCNVDAIDGSTLGHTLVGVAELDRCGWELSFESLLHLWHDRTTAHKQYLVVMGYSLLLCIAHGLAGHLDGTLKQ